MEGNFVLSVLSFSASVLGFFAGYSVRSYMSYLRRREYYGPQVKSQLTTGRGLAHTGP